MAEYLKLFRKTVDYEEYKETCTPPKPVSPTDYPVLGLPGHVITYEATSSYCPNNSYGDYDYILGACDYKNGKGVILCKRNITNDEGMLQGINATVVRFPSTVTSLTPTAFWNSRVKNVYFESTTPVTAYIDDPFYNSSIEKIYVPKDCVNVYKQSWANNEFLSRYVDIIFPEDPYYAERWVQIENTCENYNLYKQEKKQVTHDGGITWEDTGEIKKTLIQSKSAACGYAERWVDDGTGCTGFNLYEKEKKQVSHDSGATWEDTGEVRDGALIEALSETCGYDPSMSSIITYKSSYKLTETTSTKTAGLRTNAFNVTIEAHNFENGVGTIVFGGILTSIGDSAFYGVNLTSIEIPDTVTFIGKMSFTDSSASTGPDKFIIHATTPPTLQKGCITASSSGCPTFPSKTMFYVPSGSVNAYKTATNWSEFSSKIIPIT